MNPQNAAKALGRRGGQARARRLSTIEKKRIASLGGAARRESLQAAQRVADNFRYVNAMRDLQGQGSRAIVARLSKFDGPLPGIYVARS
jgi:hypothetical protein